METLKHCGPDKMVAIFQTTISVIDRILITVVYWEKMLIFRLHSFKFISLYVMKYRLIGLGISVSTKAKNILVIELSTQM